MLWILLTVGVVGTNAMLWLTAEEIWNRNKDWSAVRHYFVEMLIYIAIIAVGVLGLIGIDCMSYKEVAQTTNEWELISLADNSQISGDGGLLYIHTSIDTKEVYSFYYQVDGNGVKIGKVDAEATTIYENDNCTPHVIEYTMYTKNKMNDILRIILGFGYGGESSEKTYEIYIPTGTMFRTFSLDAQ